MNTSIPTLARMFFCSEISKCESHPFTSMLPSSYSLLDAGVLYSPQSFPRCSLIPLLERIIVIDIVVFVVSF